MNTNIKVMQDAIDDELFLADLREVMEDFRDADAEPIAVASRSCEKSKVENY